MKIFHIPFINSTPPVFLKENGDSFTKKHVLSADTVCFGVRYKDLDEDALLEEARALSAKKKYTEAITVLDDIIELNPNNETAFFRRGLAYLNLKNYEQAEEDFSMATVINPKLTTAHGFLAESLRRQGRSPDAIKCCDNALEIDPESSFLYYIKANAYIDIDDLDKAEETIDKAIDLAPYDSDCYYTKGKILLETGRLDEAYDCFENSLECYGKTENPNNKITEILVKKANCEVNLDVYDLAVATCNKCLSKDSNNEGAFFQRGLAYMGLERYPEALKDLDSAIKCNSQNHVYYHIRGFINKSAGDIHAAIADFEKSYELMPYYEIDPVVELGECNLTLGNKVKALEYFEIARKYYSKQGDRESLSLIEQTIAKITAS